MAVKISELLPPKEKIEICPGATLDIGAINLMGITKLIKEFSEPLGKLVSSSTGGQPDFSELLATAPDMVAAMIAMGADAEGQEDDIKLLPFGAQVTAAARVWELSVPEPKKLLSVLSTVLGQLKPVSQPGNAE